MLKEEAFASFTIPPTLHRMQCNVTTVRAWLLKKVGGCGVPPPTSFPGLQTSSRKRGVLSRLLGMETGIARVVEHFGEEGGDYLKEQEYNGRRNWRWGGVGWGRKDYIQDTLAWLMHRVGLGWVTLVTGFRGQADNFLQGSLQQLNEMKRDSIEWKTLYFVTMGGTCVIILTEGDMTRHDWLVGE